MPSYVIGIDLGSNSVKAAVLKGSFRGYEIEDFLSLEAVEPDPAATVATGSLSPSAERAETPNEVADDEEVENAGFEDIAPDPQALAVQRVLQAIGQAQAMVVVALPASRVSTWMLDLPFSDRKRIDQTVAFELENYVPWELEDVVIDYRVVSTPPEGRSLPPGGAVILSAMAPIEDVGDLLDRLASVDVDPRHLCLDAAELARLLPPSEEAEVLVDIGADRTLLCVARAGEALWVRSLEMGAQDWEGTPGARKSWMRQLRASLLAEEAIGVPVEAVWLTGGGSQDSNIAHEVEEILGIPARTLQLPPSQVNEDLAPKPAPEHALAYALALKGFDAKNQVGFSFRKGRFSYKADSRVKTRIALGAIAAVLLLAVGSVGMHFVNLAKLKTQLEDSNARLISTVSNTFPEVPPSSMMTPDGAIGVMQEQVYGLKWRVDALRSEDLTPLGALRELSNTIPGDLPVDVDEYFVDREMIRVRGQTDSFGSVDRLEAAILANDQFKEAKKSDVNKARDGKMRFTVTIPRKSEEETEG